jgi:nucleotide-binding universal stress UspA family protein
MSQRIIIGYQPNPRGEDALALGRFLAELLGATPVVATALPWSRAMMPAEDLDRALAAESAERSALVRDRLYPLEPRVTAIADPSPAAALYSLAEAEDASLIVVGSSHRSRMGRILLGSVSKSLLNGAPCAVAVAPRGFAQAPAWDLRRVAVAFDGSAEAWAALETAIGIAERRNGTLGLLTVAEHQHQLVATPFVITSSGELQELEHREKERVLELARRRVPALLPVESRLLTGDPVRTLAEAAMDYDLLVCGSRAYGPLRRTIAGSVSSGLAHGAERPVLILPRGAGLDPLGVTTGRVAAASG